MAQNNGKPCEGDATEMEKCSDQLECPRNNVILNIKEMHKERKTTYLLIKDRCGVELVWNRVFQFLSSWSFSLNEN